jgi:hypothetical protein
MSLTHLPPFQKGKKPARMKGQAGPAIPEERADLARVASLGCVVCRNENLGETPAHAHHINCGTMGRKASDFETIPLCPVHHQDGDGTPRYGGHIAVHRGLRAFEARYGKEQELLEQVRRELAGE